MRRPTRSATPRDAGVAWQQAGRRQRERRKSSLSRLPVTPWPSPPHWERAAATATVIAPPQGQGRLAPRGKTGLVGYRHRLGFDEASSDTSADDADEMHLGLGLAGGGAASCLRRHGLEDWLGVAPWCAMGSAGRVHAGPGRASDSAARWPRSPFLFRADCNIAGDGGTTSGSWGGKPEPGREPLIDCSRARARVRRRRGRQGRNRPATRRSTLNFYVHLILRGLCTSLIMPNLYRN